MRILFMVAIIGLSERGVSQVVREAPSLGASAEEKWNSQMNSIENNFQKLEEKQVSKFEEMRRRIMKKWPDGEMPKEKSYVAYFDGDNIRVKVDYEHQTITAEELVESISKSDVKSIDRSLDRKVKELSSSDSSSASVLYLSDDIAKADTHVAHEECVVRGSDSVPRRLFIKQYALTDTFLDKRAKKYLPIVKKWTEQNGINPALVLAIIRQESAFNPRARSWVGAIGLMQIYPKYAGRTVFLEKMGRDEIPSDEYLYDVDHNVMIGVAYLQILRDEYFKQVADQSVQQHLMVCSYNWGPNRIQSVINRGKIKIEWPSQRVYQELQVVSPAETRDYLRRVTNFAANYSRN